MPPEDKLALVGLVVAILVLLGVLLFLIGKGKL